jgi:hypothetical protein
MTDRDHLSDLQIHGLLDQALDVRTERAARAHLSLCRACARRFEAQARLFAAIETWHDAPPPHDLAQGVMERLRVRSTPDGLRLATVIQAGLAALLVVVAWPLLVSLFSSVTLPEMSAPVLEWPDSLVAQAQSLWTIGESTLRQASAVVETFLATASQWMPLWPGIVAGALLVAVLGNSVLLTGDVAGARRVRPRRL